MSDDVELEAIRAALAALNGLAPEERVRAWRYIGQRLEIEHPPSQSPTSEGNSKSDGESSSESDMTNGFASFAELYDRAGPKAPAFRALVAGYWLQVCSGQRAFEAYPANKELEHLGDKLPNVTNAFTRLKRMKPSLVIQVKKSGKAPQARKQYMLTAAGIKQVEEMIKANGV